MTQEEFLEKYGNEKVYFQRMYKHSVYYKNTELGFWCKATIEYDDEIEVEETVNSVFQFNYFDFGLLK
jgi:hypothetical protein